MQAATEPDHRPTVLVVDDDAMNLSLLSSLLKDSHRVKVANSGATALAHLRGEGNAPDLILLDIAMPGLSGYQVLGELKADPATRDIPVIFLTAADSPEDEGKGLAMGAVDYITKPVSPSLVLARVRTQLQIKEAADFLRDRNAWLQAEVARRTSELVASRELILRALAEKENLLKELYHRTRNNMQVIAGILEFEAGISRDPAVARVVGDTVERIGALALLQKKLYESRDLSRIDLGEYFGELLGEVCAAETHSRGRLAYARPDEPIKVVLDIAAPAGLVLRELVSNSLRHAWPGESGGELRVTLRRVPGGEIELSVVDDSVGLPPGFDFGGTESLGFQLIRGLAAEQLRGSVNFSTTSGFSCVVTFSDAHYPARV